MDIMKFLLSALISFIVIFVVRNNAEATTSVDVSNNGSGSNTHVNINQSSQFNSTSSNTVDSQTHVRIETNGEVKTFDTNGDESVNWQSQDGKSKVTINGKAVQGSSTAPTQPQTTVTPTSTSTPTSTQSGVSPSPTNTPSQHSMFKAFLERYFSWLKKIFGN